MLFLNLAQPNGSILVTHGNSSLVFGIYILLAVYFVKEPKKIPLYGESSLFRKI